MVFFTPALIYLFVSVSNLVMQINYLIKKKILLNSVFKLILYIFTLFIHVLNFACLIYDYYYISYIVKTTEIVLNHHDLTNTYKRLFLVKLDESEIK